MFWALEGATEEVKALEAAGPAQIAAVVAYGDSQGSMRKQNRLALGSEC